MSGVQDHRRDQQILIEKIEQINRLKKTNLALKKRMSENKENAIEVEEAEEANDEGNEDEEVDPLIQLRETEMHSTNKTTQEQIEMMC
jgi:hypothetical protein